MRNALSSLAGPSMRTVTSRNRTLAGLDVQTQARAFVVIARRQHLTVDLRLVITQRLGGLSGLFLGTATEAQQRFFIALAEASDIAFDIGLEVVVGGFDPDVKTKK